MQLFVRDASTIAVDAPEDATVHQLKQLWTLKAFGVASTVSWALEHEGRTLPDGCSLREAGLSGGAALCARLRLRGGGGDGGSTGAESRSCYLEMYMGKKPDKVNPAEELLARWTRCHISGERLAEPCVCDELGSLYNKEAIVHALLTKSMPSALAHVSGLKQLVTLKLDPAPRSGSKAGAAGGAVLSGGPSTGRASDFQCPVTGLEMNGRARFVAHRPTGRVVSERALKEAPAAVEELLGGPWAPGDLIVLNPVGEELLEAREKLAAKMEAERQKKLAKKLAKKGSAAGAEAAAGPGDAAAAAAGAGEPQSRGSNGINGSSPAAPAAGSKRPAAATAAAASAEGNPAKKLKLPDGATAEVYKSIFHTAAQAAQVKETYTARAISGRWRC